MNNINFNQSIWPDKAIYFLTDATFLHYPYFRTDEQKQIVLNQIIKLNKRLNIPILDYSIAVNHYHLKFYLDKSEKLSQIKKILRGGTSFEYRKKFSVPYKNMWQTRKILIVTTEEMNWRVSGYIIGNLLKHKEVSTFDKLKKNKFSSFWHMSNKYGDQSMRELVASVIDVCEDAWGAVDLKEFNNK